MNREYIEDLSGNVACIVPAQAALPAPDDDEANPLKDDGRCDDCRNGNHDDCQGAGCECDTCAIKRHAKRIVHEPYYWCGFCQTAFDIDYPSIRVHDNDQRPHCPNDNHRLELMSADIEVG